MFCFFRTNYIFAKKIQGLDEEIKLELIEEFANHFHETNKLPPLTSKVFAFILVDKNVEGYTFDELVSIFNVSKSSMSSSLNLLIKYDFIGQYNKIDERKRRYKLTPHQLPIRLKKTKNELIKEKYLSEKLFQYREEIQSSEDAEDIHKEKVTVYLEHLDSAIELLDGTIKKLEKLNCKL